MRIFRMALELSGKASLREPQSLGSPQQYGRLTLEHEHQTELDLAWSA
jgi:hypothetical protein